MDARGYEQYEQVYVLSGHRHVVGTCSNNDSRVPSDEMPMSMRSCSVRFINTLASTSFASKVLTHSSKPAVCVTSHQYVTYHHILQACIFILKNEQSFASHGKIKAHTESITCIFTRVIENFLPVEKTSTAVHPGISSGLQLSCLPFLG